MKEILTVSQLNDSVKLLLEEAFDFIWVEGEVGNLRKPQSGHVYFTLKDDKSQVRAVFFRQFGFANKRVGFELEEGLSILCRARLSVYQPRGEYQLIIESIEPRGIGALQKAFEQLKARLAAEGLFAEEYKKAIPYLPQRIGVVTSPTGAVIRDILNITKRRFPTVDILLAPARVQGNEAAGELIRALRNLHVHGGVDVIIIARGGGSLEDLAPFNDEALARAIFSSTIPVISAIGHETDFTICDFVADLRAPTPSAAAELVVPDRKELLDQFAGLRRRLVSSYLRFAEERRLQLADLRQRCKDPLRLIFDIRMQLDDLLGRLNIGWRREKQIRETSLRQAQANLLRQNPAKIIKERNIYVQTLRDNLLSNGNYYLLRQRDRLQKDAALLASLSPLNVLQRGYSITRNFATGEIIRRTEQLSADQTVNVQLAAGNFHAKVQKIFKE